jgi:hypothetical protein
MQDPNVVDESSLIRVYSSNDEIGNVSAKELEKGRSADSITVAVRIRRILPVGRPAWLHTVHAATYSAIRALVGS